MEKLIAFLNSMMTPAGVNRTDAGARIDEEDIRLVSGFADIFAAAMLVGAAVTLAGVIGSTTSYFLVGIALALAAWFLTPPFVEQRHFAASGVVLSIIFVLGSSTIIAPFLQSLALIPGAIASWFYWRRYRVPISGALTLICLVLTPILVLAQILDAGDFGQPGVTIGLLSAVAGVTLFGLAMYWDLSDRERTTRRSDVAFWLHLAAGPLIVHGIFSMLGLSGFGYMGLSDSDFTRQAQPGLVMPIATILVFAVFTIVALLVDRRPLLLSSLGYLILAIASIARAYFEGDASDQAMKYRAMMESTLTVTAISGLSIGLVVVVLAGAWSSIRALVLRLVPES